MTDNEELKRIYSLFTDCWRFFKKYSEVKDSDEYWDVVVDESSELSKKYNNDKFAIDLVLATITALERKAKEMRENAGTASKDCMRSDEWAAKIKN